MRGHANFLDAFMVVVFENAPSSKFSFPADLGDIKLAQTIPKFCFPEDKISLEGHDKTKEIIQEEFSFVLTVSDGSKRYGFCRRFLKKPEPSFLPVCFCLVSVWSSFSLFQQVLDHVELLLPVGKEAVQGYLNSLISQPFPMKGVTVTINVGDSGTPYRLTRSYNDFEYLDYVSFEPLFRSLPVKSILCLFASLLEERRVIGIATTLNKLSTCMNAMAALIYPFSWQVRMD
uniref:UDENN domain-containing protein n=1 Tax=Arcella intermedia TaxID=1963864 RepID=A0A6B2LGA6_9EUKA